MNGRTLYWEHFAGKYNAWQYDPFAPSIELSMGVLKEKLKKKHVGAKVLQRLPELQPLTTELDLV